jgi:hypothetical protein
LETLVANLDGKPRWATRGGRRHLVVPLVLLRADRVLNGSKGALFYPADEVVKRPGSWNGMPLLVNHPVVNGDHVSGRDPDVLDRWGVGAVYRDRVENGDRKAEGWFDEADSNRVDARIIPALEQGLPMELSTGLHLNAEPVENGSHQGKAYVAVARDYQPDHVAVLPDSIGACSVADGCGLNVNTDQKRTLWQKLGEALGLATPVPAPAPVRKEEPTVNEAQRKETISFLTANCDCWKGGEAELAKLSDDTLARLKAGAEKPTANATPTPAATPPVAQPVQPAVSQQAFDTLAANVAALTAELKKRDDREQQHAAATKQAMVDAITANIADEAQRKQMAALWSSASPELLAVELSKRGPAAVPFAQQPSYLGGAPVPLVNAKDDSDNLLPEITFNFDEMSSPKLRRQKTA